MIKILLIFIAFTCCHKKDTKIPIKPHSSHLLLLDELVGGAEVLARVTRVCHHPVELVGERAERRGALRSRGRVLAEAEVLDHERGAEAALVVVGGGHVVHDAGDGVVGVHRPAAARRRAQDRG